MSSNVSDYERRRKEGNSREVLGRFTATQPLQQPFRAMTQQSCKGGTCPQDSHWQGAVALPGGACRMVSYPIEKKQKNHGHRIYVKKFDSRQTLSFAFHLSRHHSHHNLLLQTGCNQQDRQKSGQNLAHHASSNECVTTAVPPIQPWCITRPARHPEPHQAGRVPQLPRYNSDCYSK